MRERCKSSRLSQTVSEQYITDSLWSEMHNITSNESESLIKKKMSVLKKSTAKKINGFLI